MNAKIIQLVIVPETAETRPALIALTENGQVFRKALSPDSEFPWKEIETKNFVYRGGTLFDE